MPLVAFKHLKFGNFAEKSGFLVLDQTFCVVDQLGLAVQIHDTYHLLLLVLNRPTFVDHLIHIVVGLWVCRGDML